MDARLADLLDKQAIEEVVLRYCRGIDRRDFALVRDCYHEDALDHHGSFSGNVDAFVAWVERLTARYAWTTHFVGNVLIELAPAGSGSSRDAEGRPSVAACETYGLSLHRGADSSPGDAASKPYLSLATGFRYLDRFERRRDQWRIAERTAIGEWSIRLPPELWWGIPEDHESGQRDVNDALYRLLASVGLPQPGGRGGD